MRITKKKENGFYELKAGKEIYGKEDGIRLVQIVGQYEDIEEKLGIDLITLFKAIKDNIYYNDCGKIIKVPVLGVSPMRENKFALECYYDLKNFRVDIRDYGKTWALTKGELNGMEI